MLELTVIALQAVIMSAIWNRSLQKRFPLFFSYTCYSLIAGITLFIVSQVGSKQLYIYVTLIEEAPNVILALLAMYEAFQKVVRFYYPSGGWRWQIVSVITAVLGIALWKWLKQSPIQAGPFTKAYISFVLGATYMQAAVFALFTIQVWYHGTSWERRPFLIMRGFGFASIIGMLADVLRSDFGTRWNIVFAYAPPVAYTIACVIWLVAFIRTEPDDRIRKSNNAVSPNELLHALRRIRRAMK